MVHRFQTALRVVAVNCAVFVVLLGLLDLGARVVAPRDTSALFDNPDAFVGARPFVVRHPVRGFALNPGYQTHDCSINAAGFRGPHAPDATAADQWILSLGGSTT